MAYPTQLSATTQIKVGMGKIYAIVISSTSSGTLTVYDSPDGDTNDPKILNTITPSAGTSYTFGVNGAQFSKGLYVVVANTLQFTVVYE